MQTSNVVSLASNGGIEIAPFTLVKMTAGGVDKCGAADKPIGTVLPGDLNRDYPTIQLFGAYVEAIMGDDTDIAAGDELELAANGTVVKKDAGAAVGMALMAGTETGDRVDAVIYFL